MLHKSVSLWPAAQTIYKKVWLRYEAGAEVERGWTFTDEQGGGSLLLFLDGSSSAAAVVMKPLGHHDAAAGTKLD